MVQKKLKAAILTSGGDSPGMNAAIRAIVRASLFHGFDIIGFLGGYSGILDKKYVQLDTHFVGNIIQAGGTILRCGRCKEFLEDEGQEKAAANLTELNIDVLFVIGGNGSLTGAYKLDKIWPGQIIGLPGTIDNDLAGTDHTIGFFTAINTALEAIDRIRDTAYAIYRIFIVEVMGRHSGFIAQSVGIGGGADEIIMPEKPFDLNKIMTRIERAKNRGQISYIMVVAEGVYEGGTPAMAKKLSEYGHESRVCVLGHTQRGGSPVASDRILATRLGVYAVESALAGADGVMVGTINNQLVGTPLKETFTANKTIDEYLYDIHEKTVV